MIHCGCCDGEHETVAEIRACCAENGPVEPSNDAEWEPPPADEWFDDQGGEEIDAGPGPDVAGPPIEAPSAAVSLDAPAQLGRSLVVAPGQTVPDRWSDRPRVAIDLNDPEAAATHIDALHRRWCRREAYVVELAGSATAAELQDETEQGDPWSLGPRFEFARERLAHLIWSNSIDLRDPDHPTFAPLTASLTAGGRPGDDTDIVDRDGQAVWCDGGPLDLPMAATIQVVAAATLAQHRLTTIADREPSADLAEDQLAAVRHRGGPCRVISPAGSGKTRTLTERARHLLGDRGLPSSAVCLVAYNKRAADEMAERLPDLPGLQIRTFNALALAIVNGTGPFGDPREPRPRANTIDEREVRRILDGLVDFPRRANTDPAALWIEALAKVRLGLRDPVDVAADYGGDLDGLSDVFDRFQETLDRRQVVDFDQQIYGAITVLLRDPAARRRARQACAVLLVDEFQDLTPAHVLLVRLLSGPRFDVFGVGDDDQTIYGYNGADPRWLIDYDRFFPGATSHPLTVNYRCPPVVVRSADNLLSHNRHRVAKAISARTDRTDDVLSLRLEQVGRTVDATVERAQALLRSGASPDDIVILTRVNAGLAPVQVALTEAGVAVDRVSGPEWLQRTGVRAALAWLALATEPDRLDSASLQEAARRPGRGLSRRVGEWIGEQRTITDIRRLAGRMKQARDSEKIGAFADDIEAIGRIGGRSAVTALTHVRDEIGLGSAVNSLDTSRNWTNRASHGDDLDALVQLAGLHDDATTFADWLRDRLSTRPPSGARIQMHTVHRVKGLEWPHVIVHEASARLFPHHLSEDREEERRIFHVALTRCSESATVVAPSEAPSPFIAELDEKIDPADLPPEPPPQPTRAERAEAAAADKPERATGALADALRSWRMDKARERDVPAYVIFNDKTLDDLLARRPSTLAELSACHGIGPAKIDGFGTELLEVLGTANGTERSPEGPTPTAPTPDTTAERSTPPADAADQSDRVAPDDLADRLRAWRTELADREDVPAYRVFSNKTLDDLCARLPTTDNELLACHGIGPAKLDAFGDDLLTVIIEAIDDA